MGKVDRQYYIDWLRLMTVFLLFFFHTACIFHPWNDFYVKNDPASPLITYLFVWSVGEWHMSLFFLLAGASTYFALQKRSSTEYVKERFKRLLIPLIFGILLLIPPQSYLGLLNHSDYSQSFLAWLPNFFHMQTEDMSGFFLGGFTPGHLWFILHLFLYSLIVLPLFLFLRGEAGNRWTKRITSLLTKSPVLFLIFPTLLVPISKFPWVAGGNPLFYITFFIIGFILMSDQRLTDKIDDYRLLLLLLGVIPLAGSNILVGTDLWPSNLPEWVDNAVNEYRNAFVPWFLILALLAYGKRFLNFSNRFLIYFSEGAYPIYILHNTIIIIIAFFVVQWGTSVGVKYTVIIIPSFFVTVLIYDLLVKRTNITRFLFGMKSRPKTLDEPAS